MFIMMIEQTIEIPVSRNVHFNVSLPESAPCGWMDVSIRFKPAAVQTRPSGFDVTPELDPVLEMAIKEAAEKRKAYRADPNQMEEIRALRGSLKNTSIWDGLDGVSYQRKIRDEWDDSPIKTR
jgi:hypothetical protein